jgi:hypothetical protein
MAASCYGGFMTLSRLDESWEKVERGYHQVLGTSPDGRFLAAQWGQARGSG